MTGGPYICAGRPHSPKLDDRVLDMLRRGAALSSSEIAGRLGRKASHICDVLKRLSERGAIISEGPEKFKVWRINSVPSSV